MSGWKRDQDWKVENNENCFQSFLCCESYNCIEEICLFATNEPYHLVFSIYQTTTVPQSHPSSVPFQHHNYSIHQHHV